MEALLAASKDIELADQEQGDESKAEDGPAAEDSARTSTELSVGQC